MTVWGWLGWIVAALMIGVFIGAGFGAWVQIQKEKDERWKQ